MQIKRFTNRFSSRLGGLVATVSGGLLLTLPQSAAAAPLWPEGAASPTAQTVMRLFVIVFAIGAVSLIGYVAAICLATRSKAAAEGTAADPSPKQAFWTGLATVVVLALFGAWAMAQSTSAESSIATGESELLKPTEVKTPSTRTPHAIKPPAKGAAYTIRVNAQQYLWRYQYTGLQAPWHTYSYHDLVLPAGVTVLLDFTSSDVEAAWWVPQLGGSVTAMPGYNNQVWLRADKPGIYKGANTVINGSNYAAMTTTVNVVPPMLFERWLNGKQAEIADAMSELGDEVAASDGKASE